MIVQACLNGARPFDYHPRLPFTRDALVDDARAAVAAGAAELHVHPRRADGRETLAPEEIDDTVSALRSALPGTLIGVSTGEWIELDDDRRLACIGGWKVPPDYASVNLSEPGAPAVIQRLVHLGIGVEAGLADEDDAARLLALGLAPRVLRVLIEIFDQDVAEAIALADAIASRLAAGGAARPILLHGFDDTVWPLVDHAAARHYSTRVGLEDGCLMPDGGTADGNAALVRAAVERMRRA